VARGDGVWAGPFLIGRFEFDRDPERTGRTAGTHRKRKKEEKLEMEQKKRKREWRRKEKISERRMREKLRVPRPRELMLRLIDTGLLTFSLALTSSLCAISWENIDEKKEARGKVWEKQKEIREE
jgi:hypothetical protein